MRKLPDAQRLSAAPVVQPDEAQQDEADPKPGEEADAGLTVEDADDGAREDRQSEQAAAGAGSVGSHRAAMPAGRAGANGLRGVEHGRPRFRKA